MNTFEELKDGLIILDIFKNITKKLELLENYFYEFIRLSKIKVTPIERIEFVVNLLGKIFLKEELEDKIVYDEEDLENDGFFIELLEILKKGLETISQKQNQNNKDKKEKIKIDTDENKSNFRRILNKKVFKKNQAPSSYGNSAINNKIENSAKNESKNSSFTKRENNNDEFKCDLLNANQNEILNKNNNQSEINIQYNSNTFDENKNKGKRTDINLPNKHNINENEKNFYTNNNFNSNISNPETLKDYNWTDYNSRKMKKNELFNYEIKNSDGNRFPKVINYSPVRSKSKSVDKKSDVNSNTKEDELSQKKKFEMDGFSHYNEDGLDGENYKICKNILHAQKLNKQLKRQTYLNNFINSSVEENFSNQKTINSDKNITNKNKNFVEENSIDAKYNKINSLIASKSNVLKPIEITNKVNLNSKSNYKINKNDKKNQIKAERIAKKEVFKFKNFESKVQERSRSFSKSLSRGRSRSVSDDRSKRIGSSKLTLINKLSSIPHSEFFENLNNLSNISETGKRSVSNCNKKIKEIASQRGLPKKTPIMLNNIKINFLKFIKPSYTVVYCDKEKIFKYRNKLTDPFNLNNLINNEEGNIGNMLKNSELFMKRNKRSLSKKKKSKKSKSRSLSRKKSFSPIKTINSSENISNLKSKNFSPKTFKRNPSQNISKIDSNMKILKNESKINNKPYINDKKTNSTKKFNTEFPEKKGCFGVDEIIPWIEDLNLIKPNSLSLEDLPEFASSGILLADLINRLEGKGEVLKGIFRDASRHQTKKNLNVSKILEYLRQYEKFNSRHLFSANKIIKGSPQEIYELIIDIHDYYCKSYVPLKIKEEKKLNKINYLDFEDENEFMKINDNYVSNKFTANEENLKVYINSFYRNKDKNNNGRENLNINNYKINTKFVSNNDDKNKMFKNHTNNNLDSHQVNSEKKNKKIMRKELKSNAKNRKNDYYSITSFDFDSKIYGAEKDLKDIMEKNKCIFNSSLKSQELSLYSNHTSFNKQKRSKSNKKFSNEFNHNQTINNLNKIQQNLNSINANNNSPKNTNSKLIKTNLSFSPKEIKRNNGDYFITFKIDNAQKVSNIIENNLNVISTNNFKGKNIDINKNKSKYPSSNNDSKNLDKKHSIYENNNQIPPQRPRKFEYIHYTDRENQIHEYKAHNVNFGNSLNFGITTEKQIGIEMISPKSIIEKRNKIINERISRSLSSQKNQEKNRSEIFRYFSEKRNNSEDKLYYESDKEEIQFRACLKDLNKEKKNHLICNIRNYMHNHNHYDSKNIMRRAAYEKDPKNISFLAFKINQEKASEMKNLNFLESRKNQMINKKKYMRNLRNQKENEYEKENNSNEFRMIDAESPDSVQNRITCKMINDADLIIKWLKSLKIKDAEKIKFFNDSYKDNTKYLKNSKKQDVLKEIRNGLILNDILCKIENNKPKGVIENPKSNANELWNLKKILETIPSKFLNEFAIHDGSPEFIIEFMLAIKYAYKDQTQFYISLNSQKSDMRDNEF